MTNDHVIIYKKVDNVQWSAYCTCRKWEATVGTRSRVNEQAAEHLRDVGKR